MAKTFYLGLTKAGAAVGRASKADYGYTHAGVRNSRRFTAGQTIPLQAVSFSRSAQGAMKNAQQYTQDPMGVELVEVQIVDRKTYVAAGFKA